MSSNITKETLFELQEKYEKVGKYLAEENPVSEPYRSKYKAQSILNEMKSTLVNLLDKVSSEDEINKCKITALLGSVLYDIGNTSYEIDELSTAEEQLAKCIELLNNYSVHPECIITLIKALNRIAILWSERENTERIGNYLSKAEKLYDDFISQCHGVAPLSSKELFNLETNNNGEKELEYAHTHTLYFLAQYYGKNDEKLKSAVYVHNTLKRQLESKEYDSIDWALNSATLSQYFATNNGFEESRHHLAAASVILDKYEQELEENTSNVTEEERDAKKEIFRHRSADVARCWAKYDINLLSLSQARLMRLAESDNDLGEEIEGTLQDGGVTLGSLAPAAGLDPDVLRYLKFNTLELGAYESTITSEPVSLFEEARLVFLDGKRWLTKAQEYYRMDGQASDAIAISQDLSTLYKHLAFFEDSEERQCRMNKRRADLLEETLGQINPQFYLAQCRQLWFELSEIYSELITIKKHRLRTENTPTPHALMKINNYCASGISHLQKFVASYYIRGTEKLPEILPEDYVRPILIAFFRLGKLNNDFYTLDKSMQIKNLQASIDAYKYMVTYCDKHTDAKNEAREEVGVSREMIDLLQIKLARLKESQSNN